MVPSVQRAPGVKTAFRMLFVLLVALAGGAGFLIGRLSASAIHPREYPSDLSDPKSDYEPSNGESAAIINAHLPPPAVDLRQRASHPPLDSRDEYMEWMLNNTSEEEFFISWRWDCAQDLLRWSSIREKRVLEAFLRTPREIFIREKNKALAYEHRYLAIGYGATITDPWVVSVMTQTINPEPDHRVLEIGTGSGYQAAILAQMTNHVYTVEIIEALAEETDRLYRTLGPRYPEYANIHRRTGDGYYGWPEYAPFDRIIVTCAIDHIPPSLLKQLSPEGIMVIPVGPPAGQTLMKISKSVADGVISYEREGIMPVKFIPFTKKNGRYYSGSSEDSGPESMD